MVEYADREYSAGVYREYVRARGLKVATFRRRLRGIRRRLGAGAAGPPRLLDVGCSCGYFLDVALEDGFDAEGIEFSAVAIAAASDRARPRIRRLDLNDPSAREQRPYDVIAAFDIIEHNLDPLSLLEGMRRMLTPSGLLVVTTPDTGHVLRSLMGASWPMLQPFQHTILFSARSLRLALTRAGYEAIETLPASKVLTPDYLLDQIRIHNPLLSRLYEAVRPAIPEGLRNAPLAVNIGEVMAFARGGRR